MAHNGGADRDKALGSIAAPAHTGTTKAGLKLLGFTFDHAGANREALFAEFKILHAPLVGAEIVGFGAQVIVALRLAGGGLRQGGRNLVGVALEQAGFMLVEPA